MTQDDSLRENLKVTGYWGKRATGCLFVAEDTGKILFSKRGERVLEPHTWGTWGGAAHDNETVFEALVREVCEEAAIDISIYQSVPLYVFRASGFEYHNFAVVVPKQFSPVIEGETAEWRWVDFGSWPEPLHPGTAHLLRDQESLARLRALTSCDETQR